jgi:hypothetical protein
VATLLISLVAFYVAMAASKFTLSRRMGIICSLIYAVVLTLAVLVELNVFVVVNLPPCDIGY